MFGGGVNPEPSIRANKVKHIMPEDSKFYPTPDKDIKAHDVISKFESPNLTDEEKLTAAMRKKYSGLTLTEFNNYMYSEFMNVDEWREAQKK
jgi:hypothetical protein